VITTLRIAVRNLLFILFGIGMVFLITPVQAQPTDSLAIDTTSKGAIFDFHTARVESFSGDDMLNFKPIDTTLFYFHQFNAARSQPFQQIYLGNLGAPAYNPWFTFDRTLGFDYGRHDRDIYLTDINEVQYYRCNVPFTNVYYVAGSQGEQVFHVTHTRNVGRDFNIAIDFKKQLSEGYFQHSANDYADVVLSGWYSTKNQQYSIYFAGIRGKMESDINGGISNDSAFLLEDPASVLPNLDQAVMTWDNWQGQLYHQYAFGKKISYPLNDSTSSTYFVPKVILAHTFGTHDYFYQYEDADIDRTFYGSIYEDADTLRDRTQVLGFYNKLSIGSTPNTVISKDSTVRTKLNWELYGLQQWHELSDDQGKRNYTNLIAGLNINARYLFDSLLTVRYAAAYDIDAEDAASTLRIKFPNVIGSPEIIADYKSVSPTIIQNYYYGFDDRWDNNFTNTNYLSLGIRMVSHTYHFELYVLRENITNYIAYNTDEFYTEATLENTKVYVSKLINAGNFHFNNVLGVQIIDGNLNYPQLIASANWYYSNHLFKSALFFQAGIDVWYNAAFLENGYDPVVGQFIQNATFFGSAILEKPTYPVIDLYMNFDVQTLRFFVKLDNAAQGLFNKGTYVAPLYPYQPRAFRLGLNWFLYY
jgi:Putative porin